MTTSAFSRWLTPVLLGLVLIMAAEIVYLVIQNRALRARVAEASLHFEPLETGSQAPSISGQDLTGAPVTIRYGEGAPYTLLFCFSPTCGACEGNVTCWNQVFAEAISENLHCVGFCAGPDVDARDWVEQHGVTYPVMSINDQRMWEALHGSALPQTILISPDGLVKQVWMGTLDDKQCLELNLALTKISVLKSVERASH